MLSCPSSRSSGRSRLEASCTTTAAQLQAAPAAPTCAFPMSAAGLWTSRQLPLAPRSTLHGHPHPWRCARLICDDCLRLRLTASARALAPLPHPDHCLVADGSTTSGPFPALTCGPSWRRRPAPLRAAPWPAAPHPTSHSSCCASWPPPPAWPSSSGAPPVIAWKARCESESQQGVLRRVMTQA